MNKRCKRQRISQPELLEQITGGAAGLWKVDSIIGLQKKPSKKNKTDTLMMEEVFGYRE